MPIMKPLNVQISNVTPANIQQLKCINIATLPVRYTDKFYRDLLTENSPEFMKFACWNGFCIGAVCARIEAHETIEDTFKLYFMTINVLPTYRRRGIATVLLNHVMDEAMKNEKIIEVYLHVQTTNDAKDFYISHGFKQIEIVKNYYKRVEPPDAFLLKKSLKERPIIEKNVSNQNQQEETC